MYDRPLRLVKVFEGTNWEAGLVQSLLNNAEIETFLADEINGQDSMFRFTPGSGGVKVMISSDDFEKGREVVNAFYENEQKD